MDLGIKGRRAIVNGGSAGLARGAALALAREGATVFVSARGEERLLKACQEIADITGSEVIPVVADHATSEGREQILAACPEPDILIATCSPPELTEDFREISPEDWHKNLDLTLLSPIEMMKSVIDGMIDRRWGRIVNIGTTAAKYPIPPRILSGPSRAALANYCVAVAKQVIQHNVTINMLLPGMHDTDGSRALLAKEAAANGITIEEQFDLVARTVPIPAGHFGDAEDCGAMAAMFCSEQAKFVTCQSLCVDGGYSSAIF
jgi:3-oxoacyl-[acyl-carrier protein] reductase